MEVKEQLIKWFKEGYRKLYTEQLPAETREVKITYYEGDEPPILGVPLPKDFMDYTYVGMCINGEFISLT